MNIKTIISFLTFMVVVVIAFLVISTSYETTRQESYGSTILAPAVSYRNFKSFRPSASSGRNVTYPQLRPNTQTPFASQGFLPQTAPGKGAENTVMLSESSMKSSYRQGSYNLHSTSSTPSLARSSSGMLMSGTTGRGSANTPSTSSAAVSSGLMSSRDVRPFGAPSNQPFSGGISPGLPDPGGNLDDSCDDDIVFLPVPDGLWYMIFLSMIYALIKLIGRRKTEKIII